MLTRRYGANCTYSGTSLHIGLWSNTTRNREAIGVINGGYVMLYILYAFMTVAFFAVIVTIAGIIVFLYELFSHSLFRRPSICRRRQNA